MDFNAVYHRADDNFCYPLNENELVINIKTGYDIENVSLIHGDPFTKGILGGAEQFVGAAHKMTDVKRLKRGLLWTIIVNPPFKRIKYYFELKSANECFYLFEDGFITEEQVHLPKRSHQFFIFPWMNPADIAVTPKWVNETVWYQIFPDRFCNGDEGLNRPDTEPWVCERIDRANVYYGGDIIGIIKKLDYLKDLGVSGLYLTPINEAPSCHKYDTTDYRKIDPHFGSAESFKRLVSEAHARGIRVMLDGVFNHSGALFAPWLDVVEKGADSEFFDWFMVESWPFDFEEGAAKKGQFYSFAFSDKMPKLNTNNQDVIDYFVGICEEWIRDYDIDGIRLDVANEVSHSFCKILRKHLKRLKADFYILGEIWHDAMPWLRGDEFDAVMNYPLADSVKDFWVDKALLKNDFEYMINRCYSAYTRQINDVLFNMLDSHDTKRLRSSVRNLDEYFQQLCVLFCLHGSLCIYYGTEIAMEGGHDPDCRRAMPWDDIEGGKYDEEIQVVRKLIKLRGEEPLLRNGEFRFPQKISEARVIEFNKVGNCGYFIEVILNLSGGDVFVGNEGEVLFERGFSCDVLRRDGVLIRKA